MSNLAISIRPAEERDLSEINRIYNREIEFGTATWDTEPWPLERRREWWAGHSDSLQPVLVAEVGGAFAGFAYLTLMSQKHGWRFTREDTIYIDEAYRGQGVGKALLAAILDEARELGVRLVVASITSTNETSIRLHQQFGFEAMGTMHNAGYKFGRWMDTTYMQLDLGEPAPGRACW
jgi:L-amino acid N-acyltransferase